MEFLNKDYCKMHITKTASPGALLQSPKRENSHGNALRIQLERMGEHALLSNCQQHEQALSIMPTPSLIIYVCTQDTHTSKHTQRHIYI